MENMAEYFMKRNQSLMATLKELSNNGEDLQDVMEMVMEVINIEALTRDREN
jgi:hypothetical protein